ncbi:MAG: hypothetical protein ACREBG_21125 [Pyrinomonadaceae bacterium]
MTLTLDESFLLNLPLMTPAATAAKEKRRSSGPSRSYLQTRVRGSRLYEAARILAIVELSSRLHQAYRQAYDKQASDRLLPQNPVPRPGPDPTDRSRSLTGAQEKVKTRAIDGARALLTGECFDFIKGNSQFDPLKVLDDLERGGGFRFKSNDNPHPFGKRGPPPGEIKIGGAGSADTIYLWEGFFDPGPAHFTKGSLIVLNPELYQQEVILHELKHALTGVHIAEGDYDAIREKCFGFLKK